MKRIGKAAKTRKYKKIFVFGTMFFLAAIPVIILLTNSKQEADAYICTSQCDLLHSVCSDDETDLLCDICTYIQNSPAEAKMQDLPKAKLSAVGKKGNWSLLNFFLSMGGLVSVAIGFVLNKDRTGQYKMYRAMVKLVSYTTGLLPIVLFFKFESFNNLVLVNTLTPILAALVLCNIVFERGYAKYFLLRGNITVSEGKNNKK